MLDAAACAALAAEALGVARVGALRAHDLERDLAAEWIPEKLLERTREELPHATAVLVEGWTEREDGLVSIDATVLVERDSQKQIVIGRSGQLLKEVGSEARADLERLLGRRVFLRLWVKTHRDWRNDERVLRRLGLS